MIFYADTNLWDERAKITDWKWNEILLINEFDECNTIFEFQKHLVKLTDNQLIYFHLNKFFKTRILRKRNDVITIIKQVKLHSENQSCVQETAESCDETLSITLDKASW